MATNKNALIRYRTIDRCLQNKQRKWTLEDLIDACSDALYELEGKHDLVSKRTLQLDIQIMRSDKLGYDAPIEVYQRKYYRYGDPEYSISRVPISRVDMDILEESVFMLSQFKHLSLFSELHGIIQKLEDKVYRSTGSAKPIIHMEKNEQLKGLEFLEPLYQAISSRNVLRIFYQSFKSVSTSEFCFHPYILKEYNNRWFLVGRDEGQEPIKTLALDRIVSIELVSDILYNDRSFDAEEYYRNTYGVTVLNDTNLYEMIFKVNRLNAPYVLTKPFHESQRLVESYSDGSILVSINVHHNFEIERLILGFGDGIEVLSPARLKRRIKQILQRSLDHYRE